LHRFVTVAEHDRQTDRATDICSKTDASATAKMREALHTVAREKSCAILRAKAVPEMTYTVSGGTLNPTHSLTR